MTADTLLERARAHAEAGRTERAVAVCRQALQLESERPETWTLLAQLHAERGDTRRSRACRQRAGGQADDQLDVEAADLHRFLALFAGREDAHARQWHDPAQDRSGYGPVHEPMSVGHVRAHLQGRLTLGAYLLRADSTVHFVVVDLDVRKEALASAVGDAAEQTSLNAALDEEMQRLSGVLGQLGLSHLLEDSGRKGRHLWVFLDEPMSAGDALQFGRALLAAHPPRDPRLATEFFPKQARLGGKGLGNLVKLPLGRHQVTGRRCALLRADGTADPKPWSSLRRQRRVTADALRRATSVLEPKARRAAPRLEQPGPAVRPRPAPPEPKYEEADLAADREVQEVLAGCGVLRRLVTRSLAKDSLGHDELVALEHTLGHLESGPKAVNLLLERVPGVPVDRRLKSRLRGSPSSCRNLRRKLPGLASAVGCNCTFTDRLPTYPHPLLHRSQPHEAELVVLEE